MPNIYLRELASFCQRAADFVPTAADQESSLGEQVREIEQCLGMLQAGCRVFGHVGVVYLDRSLLLNIGTGRLEKDHGRSVEVDLYAAIRKYGFERFRELILTRSRDKWP